MDQGRLHFAEHLPQRPYGRAGRVWGLKWRFQKNSCVVVVVYLGEEENLHFAGVFCLYLRRFRRGFGLFPSYMTLRSARVWFLVLFRHFKFSSKSLRRPYTPKTQVPYIQIHPTKKTTTQPNLNHHTSTRPPHIQFQDSKTTTHRQFSLCII